MNEPNELEKALNPQEDECEEICEECAAEQYEADEALREAIDKFHDVLRQIVVDHGDDIGALQDKLLDVIQDTINSDDHFKHSGVISIAMTNVLVLMLSQIITSQPGQLVCIAAHNVITQKFSELLQEAIEVTYAARYGNDEEKN